MKNSNYSWLTQSGKHLNVVQILKWNFLESKILTLLVIFVLGCANVALSQKSEECPPPPGCYGDPAILECDGEVTSFYWILFPGGDGSYDLFVLTENNQTLNTTYYLMDGDQVVRTYSGTSGFITKLEPKCYTLKMCVQTNGYTRYCCKTLPCLPKPDLCCELRYTFFAEPNGLPTWVFADGATGAGPQVEHEYTNVNTYPIIGTPTGVNTCTLTLPSGLLNVPHTIHFPEGIYAGNACKDQGLSSILMNSIDNNLLVFPVNTYNQKNISIQGSLTFDVSYTFDNCDFCMHPDARLVSSTSNLSVSNGTLFHERICGGNSDPAWYGIELGGGTFSATGSKFTGAYNALYSDEFGGAAQLKLVGNTFEKNYLGIKLFRSVTFSSFTQNVFDGAASYPVLSPGCPWATVINKPNKPTPFAGIFAASQSGQSQVVLNLPFSAFNSQANLFNRLTNGIYLVDVSSRLQHCRFTNIMSTGVYQFDDGKGIFMKYSTPQSFRQSGLGRNSIPTFENCYYSIYLEGENTPSTSANLNFISTQNNMIVQNGYGLYAFWGGLMPGSRISDNSIYYDDNWGVNGILMSSKLNLEITRNRIEGDTYGGGIRASSLLTQFNNNSQPTINIHDHLEHDGNGIFNVGGGVTTLFQHNALIKNNDIKEFTAWGISNEGSSDLDIRCNRIYTSLPTLNPQTWNLFLRNNTQMNVFNNDIDGADQGIHIEGGSNNTTVACNTIGTHDFGLLLDGVIGEQLLGGKGSGNKWVGSYGTWAARNNSGSLLNKIFYEPGDINLTQVSNSPFVTWFAQATTASSCPETCATEEQSARSITAMDLQIANGQSGATGLNEYSLKQHLFTDLLRFPALVTTSPAMQSFLSSFSMHNGGKLLLVQKAMMDIADDLNGQDMIWHQALQQLSQARESLATLDSLVQDGADISAQYAQRQSLEQLIASAATQIKSISNANAVLRSNAVSSLLAQLNAIQPTTTYEENEQVYTRIVLTTLFLGMLPDASQMAHIEQIAQQCRETGGQAVTMARSMYLLIKGEEIDINCDSEDTFQRSGAPLQQDNVMQQYRLVAAPNPANTILELSWGSAPDQHLVMDIIDSKGKTVWSDHIAPGQTTRTLNTTALKSGVYWARLSDTGNLKRLALTSIIIQH